MSLQYIIDGYNVINHHLFTLYANRKKQQSPASLQEFICSHKPCGSPRNKITIVFDGYPKVLAGKVGTAGIEIIFSKTETADERIKRLIERCANPKTAVVVSDDKEIRLFARFSGASAMGVEEFLNASHSLENPFGRKEKHRDNERESAKPELSYSQMEKINRELRGKWLKE